MQTSFKSLGSKKTKIWWFKKTLRVSINFYKKCLPIITWNKKHLSKQIEPTMHTLQKTFFAVLIFEGL